MLAGFRAKDRLLTSWPELRRCLVQVSAAWLAPTSSEVVTEFQSDSARTDLPV